MVLLALPPADHLLIERDRGHFVPSRRRRMMANVRVERLLKIPAEPSPELRIPGAAAQTRLVSMAGIRLGSWESARARLVSPAQASLPRSWPTPELRTPNAAAQTRIVSKARIRLDSRKSVRSFKGIFCDDISESAVGTLITERPPHRSVRAQFGHTACMGLSLSSGINAIFVVLCHSILLFDPRREHSFVPTACFHHRPRAAAVKDGASSAPPKACP